jgi:benzoate transport
MTGDIRAALRDGPMTMLQVGVVTICTLLNMIDGFDVLATSFTAPLIAKEWNVDPATLGILLSAGLAGMAAGSLFLSPLADLVGRRAIVLLCTAIISVGMLASAVTGSVWALAIFRLVTGLGVGGVLSSGNTLLSEYAPQRWRDLSISFMVVGYSGGAIVGGSISAALITLFGWRSAFVFGGLCSTLLIPAVLRLPESLDFILARNGRNALAQVNSVMGRLGCPPLQELPDVPREEAGTPAVFGVFARRFRAGTALICISFFMLMLSFYFVLSWTPKNLVDLGFSVSEGIYASVLLNAGGIVGGLMFGFVARKTGARRVSAWLLVALFVAIVAYGALQHGIVPVMTGAAVAGFFMIGSMASLYSIVPQIFPARVRNTGTGLAIGFGRLGAVAGPWLGGLLIAAGWQRFTYYTVLAIPILVSAYAVRRIPLLDDGIGTRPAASAQSFKPAE